MTRSSHVTSSSSLLVVRARGVRLRTAAAARVMKGTLLLLPLTTLLLPLSTEAKLPPGTGITASKTATGHLTSTSVWTVAKSSSVRWAEDEGNSYGYESRVDECVRSQ